MRQMKDSGIEWIGKIPETWEVKRLKNLCTSNESMIADGDWIESPDISDEGIRYYTTGNIGDGVFKNQGNGFISESTFKKLNCTAVYPGDLVFSRLNNPIGRACIIPNNYPICIVAVDNVIVRPDSKYDKRFLVYISMCPGYQETNMLIARGTTMQRMSRSQLQNVDMPIPPLADQQRIADYLDENCGEIDSLIGLQEQMIEKLKAYKQSVITEAVTKGLDPNAKLVPSGIDWIGEVPEGWSKDKVIRCFKKIGSGTTPKSTDDNQFQGDINWLQSGDINGTDLFEASKHISEQTLTSYSALSVYKAPFIIIAMYGASVGNISISHIDACVNQACCVLSFSNLNFKYAFYALKSAKPYLIYRAEGGGQPNISQDKLKSLWIPRPQMNEQYAIASYLDEKCADIDRLIALKQQKIESLKDYKKSVIYEAVTGKTEI